MTGVAAGGRNLAYLADRVALGCVCGADSGLTIRRTERNGLRFRYKTCLRCGHVWTSDPLSQSAAEHFYSTSDYRNMYFPGESVEDLLVRQTPKPNTRSRLLDYVERSGCPGKSVLDWGCGGGWNLVPFRDAGWQTIGFDYDQPFVAMGRKLLNLDLHVIDSTTLDTAKAFSADVIILYHVLEHALDPVNTLSFLGEISRPETRLVVGIPLIEKISSWKWRSFFHVAHIHYFSRSSFKQVAAMAGWTIIEHQPNSSTFLLRKSGIPFSPEYRLADVVTSLYFLGRGFIAPVHRSRLLVRNFLSAIRLLNLARKIKRLFL